MSWNARILRIVTNQTPIPPTRLTRILVYMMIAVLAISIICLFAVPIGTATGMQGADFTVGIWPTITVMPLVGLPIAFVLIIVLTILNARRRIKDAQN